MLCPKATPTPSARLRRRPSAARRGPAAELHQGRLIGGATTWNPGRSSTVEPAYRYRSAIRLAPIARIFIRSVTFNLTIL